MSAEHEPFGFGGIWGDKGAKMLIFLLLASDASSFQRSIDCEKQALDLVSFFDITVIQVFVKLIPPPPADDITRPQRQRPQGASREYVLGELTTDGNNNEEQKQRARPPPVF
jgi:hypothetical protein